MQTTGGTMFQSKGNSRYKSLRQMHACHAPEIPKKLHVCNREDSKGVEVGKGEERKS